MIKKNRSKFAKIICRIFLVIMIAGLIGLVALGGMNIYMIESTDGDVHSLEDFEASEFSSQHYDAVIVLGCAVYKNGKASPMLADRLRTAAAVYKTGCADLVLVSGDSEEPDLYDETGTMKEFLIQEGVPEADILCDPMGLSTYETALRSVSVFGISSAVVVTTGFHCGRAVYDCRMFGIQSIGVEAVNSGYVIRPYNYLREFIARGKDLVFTVLKPGA